MDSLCHPWFTTTNLSYRFPIFELPPPPCAVLLVYICDLNASVLARLLAAWISPGLGCLPLGLDHLSGNILGNPRSGGFHIWGYPNSWMIYSGKSQSQTDDLGVPISGNVHTIVSIRWRSQRPYQAARHRSYRLSLFFIAFPLSKLPSPGLPGHIYIYI